MVADLLNHDAKLAEVVRRLVEAYAPERIYLFGSKARGDDGPDSDYDLMVLVSDDSSKEQRDGRLGHRLMWGLGVSADILVWTRNSFDRRAHVVCSLPATVLREGKLLYEA
jgi:uncharacterized protein